MKKYNVVIVGGGFAGLTCCLRLIQHDIPCMIIEKGHNLLGKVCGDALTVSALQYFNQIGIDPTMIEGKKVYSKKIYKDGSLIAEYKFSELFEMDFEYGVSRDLLIEHLLRAALANGATITWNHTCSSIENRNKEFCIDGTFLADEVVLACGVNDRRLRSFIQGDLPKDFPVGMSARVQGDCEFSSDSFHYFYSDRYGNGYAWLFPVGNHIWNIGIYGCERFRLKQLYDSFEKQIFHHSSPIKYLRAPGGALIGATKEPITNSHPFLAAGDCSFSARYETGEGISFAVRDGIAAADRIISLYRKNHI